LPLSVVSSCYGILVLSDAVVTMTAFITNEIGALQLSRSSTWLFCDLTSASLRPAASFVLLVAPNPLTQCIEPDNIEYYKNSNTYSSTRLRVFTKKVVEGDVHIHFSLEHILSAYCLWNGRVIGLTMVNDKSLTRKGQHHTPAPAKPPCVNMFMTFGQPI
jgi:hypothetical protein